MIINAAVGGVMGCAFSILLETGRLGLGILVFVAWIIGMINSLIKQD